MRLVPALASVLVAMAVGAGVAQATPGTAFALQTSRPCLAGTCRALLTYDSTGLLTAVRVEVDWDTRDSAGAFQPDDEVDCTPALPDDPDYEALPCEANSPAFRVPGTAQVAIRVTDTVDGTQATATQPVVVAPARAGKTVPGQRGATVDLCAPRQAGVQCGPGNGRRTSGGGDKVPHNGWPAVTGILWKVLDGGGHKKVGGPDNDELLGHHGSDRLFGGAGNDILWGDWDPVEQQHPPAGTASTAAPATTGSTPATARRSSRAAPARTTSGPTTAAAPSTAARARTPPGSSSTAPGSCATASASCTSARSAPTATAAA